MNQTIIKTNKLCKTFSTGGSQQHVLKNLDLSIYEGDFTIIMGASGSGKSTLLYVLSGMDQPSLGNVILSGTDISTLSVSDMAMFRRTHCGFVFQQIHLLDNMSVLDNILVSGLLTVKDKKEAILQAKKLLAQVGIREEDFNKFPAQLSGGEAQRVGIIRALVNRPSVVFADEPTGALNSAFSKQVLDTLSQVHSQGQSLVVVTHDIHTARRGNRILYLKDGTVCGECLPGPYVEGSKERHQKLNTFLAEMGW